MNIHGITLSWNACKNSTFDFHFLVSKLFSSVSIVVAISLQQGTSVLLAPTPHDTANTMTEPETEPERSETTVDIFSVILAIILPPLGVGLKLGCGTHLVINILLTLLGFIPGIIHALIIICVK